MNTWAAKEDNVCSMCVRHYCVRSSCILFHDHIKYINKALISKTVFLTSCEQGQKFQLNCALSWLSLYERNS